MKKYFLFSLWPMAISLKYQHNIDTAPCNWFQCSRNLLVKFYHKIKQPSLPPPPTPPPPPPPPPLAKSVLYLKK